MADNKEHHLCFAYRGERMNEDLFEGLKFANAQGTTTPDGVQLIRISLQKQCGRRLHTIPKVIDQYNRTAVADIKPIINQDGASVYCFKLSHPSNPILLRIAADKGTTRYWSWNTTTPQEKSAKKYKALLPKIKQAIDGLKIDQSTLPVERICEELQAKLEEDAVPEEEQSAVITQELKKYIGREQMYIVAPPPRQVPSRSAGSLLFQLDDLLFKNDDEPTTTGPNDTITSYFKKMLPEWEGMKTVCVTSSQVVATLNNNSEGLYRRTCVPVFMDPFIQDGSVETSDNVRFVIHTERIAEKIKK